MGYGEAERLGGADDLVESQCQKRKKTHLGRGELFVRWLAVCDHGGP
jgi:hypothetical protein